ncbi:MAG TPA: M28 family metallopeptidase [Vicinamibacterales bacterium]|nr:M28 family metallopeptidase [Vicinamibacterales bacterium]
MKRIILGLSALLAAAALAPLIAADAPSIDGARILNHIKVLASDEFQGRKPGTEGEEKTIAYLESEFKKLGLKPGNTDGTFVQKVPMVGITPEATPLVFKKGDRTLELKYRDEYVAWSKRVTERVGIDNSDVVFVGYGVQAPEFKWDDFKGVDVKGKTIVVLINDPPVTGAGGELDPKTFGGKAMTYYGRWTYKFEKGAELGAAGVLVVHETGPAGYGFNVVQGNVGEKLDLVTPDRNMGRAAIEGWMTLDKARELFTLAGQDFDALRKAAVTREFKPVPLGVTASVRLTNTLRTMDSRNVVAKLEGSDPALKDEYVVYTSHWDHFGIGAPEGNDRIYNGAADNASGVAVTLEIARAFTEAKPAPKRSILFLIVTAEEQGLLGSEYYAVSPIYPLEKTVAAINIDGVNTWGRTKDVVLIGMGASDLDDYTVAAAKEQGRTVVPDAEPEKGFYYRSDHFNFAKRGVPALDPSEGTQFIGKPADFGMKMRERFTAEDYHQPSDEIKPDWDLSGAVEDGKLFYVVGYSVANAAKMPEWKPGNEFKAIRDKMLRKGSQ